MFLTTTDQRENPFDNLFNGLFYNSNNPEYRLNSSHKHYNIDTDDSGVTLTMNVPGYNKKLIDVSVDGDLLIIEGNSNSGDTNGFIEKFSISDKLDINNIKATVTDGILNLNIPYVESVLPRRIDVKVG